MFRGMYVFDGNVERGLEFFPGLEVYHFFLVFNGHFLAIWELIIIAEKRAQNPKPRMATSSMDTVFLLITKQKRRGFILQEDFNVIHLSINDTEVHHPVLKQLISFQLRIKLWNQVLFFLPM